MILKRTAAMPTTTILEWNKRRTKETRNGFLRLWRKTVCGQYAVVESTWQGEEPYTTVYALRADGNGGWDMLSRHRKVSAARRSCEKDAR